MNNKLSARRVKSCKKRYKSGIYDRKKGNKTISSYYFFILIILICIYHIFFVRSTIPPQAGWWHYIGWRINEGDILYRDIYCHVQPFFPWFVAILYKVFGSNFILYIIPGLLIRISETIMIYKILLKVVKPAIAVFASFISIIFTISTLYDIVFDYNTTVLFLTITNAYLFVKFLEYYDIKKKKNLYCILSGAAAGVHFMTKQNTGTIVPFFVFVLLIIITLKKEGKHKLIANIGRFLMGALIVVLPALIYILAVKAFPAYIHCVIFGMSAKGSMINKLSNIMNNMLNLHDILITITVLIFMYLQKYKLLISNKLYYTLDAYFLLVIMICVWERFGYALRGLQEVFNIAPEFLAISLFLTLLYAIYRLFKRRNTNTYITGAIIICIFAMTLFYWSGESALVHRTIFYTLDFYAVKTYLVYIIHYFYFFFWVKDTWKIVKKKEDIGVIYVFNTIIMALYFASLLSSTPDEMFILPSAAYVLSQLLSRDMMLNFGKNVVLIYCSIAFVLICFSQKMFMPYTWHGWSDEAIEKDNLTPSTIPGLKGYLLPENTEAKYELIVNAILENSSEEDVVYQFPTITLFNVLTHRKVPTYMPIHYFDVCSDETAIADAEYLNTHLPKIVLWDELGEERWAAHEQLFRGGERSGQRALQDFYNTTVHEKYSLEVSVENNLGENIEVWILNE